MNDYTNTDDTASKQYPNAITYAISDFYNAKRDVERVIDEMHSIRGNCEIVCFHRGDLTGQAYGMSYTGLEDAGKLLAEFERKIASYDKSKEALEKALPSVDSEWFIRYGISIKHEREQMNSNFERIRKFFDLTHEYYKQYPAPTRINHTRSNIMILVGWACMAYTAWHLFF
ncbi:hypothetical protein ABEG90_09025 [Pantoea agglomerans]|uniref:hypothetical protein n=1 Tax=Enterobacter agglomerans TaxID=549 RepID=UPI0032081322